MSRSLANLLFWLAVVCCAIGQLLILRSVLRAGSGGGGVAMPVMRRGTELMWAVVPALALAVVLAVTWRAIRALPDESDRGAAHTSAR